MAFKSWLALTGMATGVDTIKNGLDIYAAKSSTDPCYGSYDVRRCTEKCDMMADCMMETFIRFMGFDPKEESDDGEEVWD